VPSNQKLKYEKLLSDLTRPGAHALFPNDFEYYLCALELVNSRGIIVDYFIFPVTPGQMSYNEPQVTNIKKTAGGVTVLKSSTFTPIDITLSGTFGRKLRLLLGQQRVGFTAVRFSTNGGIWSKAAAMAKTVLSIKPNFSPGVKTGYGATKILQAMCDKSTGLDKRNKPYRLNLFNLALNANHMVEVVNLTLTQDKSASNMMWNYSLSLKAVANLDDLQGALLRKASLAATLAMGVLQKKAESVVSQVTSQIDDLEDLNINPQDILDE
jgi:hypothetical protein